MDLDYWELSNKTLEHQSLGIKENIQILDVVEYEGSLYTVIENAFSEVVLKPLAKFKLKERKGYDE